MDSFIDGAEPETTALSYDDVAYEEQIPAPSTASLANRIGSTKVYLLSDSSTSRVGKRKHDEEEPTFEDDAEMDEDLSYRPNALLLEGTPIADLPTARIFAYAKHFDAHPMALEWINDYTAILVFESKGAARMGYQLLQKSASEDADEEGFVAAHPIPIALWPPEKRINSSLGKGEGLKGIIRMRWARDSDVKVKGAKNQSQFYKRHGATAGKELYNGRDLPPPKRRRGDESAAIDEEAQRAKLDEELDDFLAEEDDTEPAAPASPPSRMRSDYIADDGRTLLERTSLLRAHPELSDAPIDLGGDLASRLLAPLPRHRRSRRERVDDTPEDKLVWGREDSSEWRSEKRPRIRRGRIVQRDGRSNGERRGERPRKTQQELEDELDAYLNSADS